MVKSDYFGAVPADRLKVTPEAVLFRADAKFRSKIGVPQKRAKNVLGSIDFKNNVLTLVSFNMPADPTKELYMNNAWELPQPKPYVGDVVNSYNDGPNDLGKQFGEFYEIESLSPAKELKTGESLTHTATARSTSKPTRPSWSNWPRKFWASSGTPCIRKCSESKSGDTVYRIVPISMSPLDSSVRAIMLRVLGTAADYGI